MEENKTFDEMQPKNAFKEGLMERHAKISVAIHDYLLKLSEPVMLSEGVSEIHKIYGYKICVLTFKKAVIRSINKDGNPYGLCLKHKGQYNIVYKKVKI